MIVRISGGIGNQMFQYALKRKFDVVSSCRNYIDLSFYDTRNVHQGYELEKVFGICDSDKYLGSIKAPSEQKALLYKLLYKMNKRMLITSKYAMEILIDFYSGYKKHDAEYYYFDGYWQSEDYFSDIQDEIRSIFTFNEFSEKENLELLDRIKGKQTVALHVRRGDFLKSSKFVCLGETDYYTKAITYISNRINNPVFVVISDDINWCKVSLELDDNTIFVDWNKGSQSYRDMQIMTVCDHCIVANSSFSWWGAWLNSNPNKIVVAPEKFYVGTARNEAHLIPEKWVKIQYTQN